MMHQFSYRVFLIIFLSFFSLVGMADCPIKVETPDIRSAGRSLEEAANAVENGLKKFDPIALNKLLEENDSLRNTLSSIKVRLEGFSQGFTIIHLKNQRLRLKVIDYSGDLIVKAYINPGLEWSTFVGGAGTDPRLCAIGDVIGGVRLAGNRAAP